jgi:hypothetical protein
MPLVTTVHKSLPDTVSFSSGSIELHCHSTMTHCDSSLSESESESELLYDWRFTSNQFVLAPNPWRLTTSFFFQLNTCSHSPYVISSLTRGWVCCLQLLLALTSAVILRSESRRTHDHILLSYIRVSPNLEASSPYLYPPGTGWPSHIPRHWAPFPSPFTTRMATVEVFDPATPWRASLLCFDA